MKQASEDVMYGWSEALQSELMSRGESKEAELKLHYHELKLNREHADRQHNHDQQ